MKKCNRRMSDTRATLEHETPDGSDLSVDHHEKSRYTRENVLPVIHSVNESFMEGLDNQTYRFADKSSSCVDEVVRTVTKWTKRLWCI